MELILAARMRWYKCVNVAAREGLGAECTPDEVARMSFTSLMFTIIEDSKLLALSLTSLLFMYLSTQLLVAVLVEELVLVLVEDLLCLHLV